jgi:predicted bacteriocin transport accessory protein
MNEKKINGDKFSAKEIVIGLVIAAIVIAIGIFAFMPSSNDNKSNSQVAQSKKITPTTYSEAKKSIEANKENAVIVIGNDGCIHCVNTKPVVEEYAKDKNVKFYYINSLENQNLTELKNDGVNVVGTPTSMFAKNGVIIKNSDVPDEYEKAENKSPDVPFVIEGELNAKSIVEITTVIKLNQ